MHQQCLRAHEEGCVEELTSHTSNRKTVVLRTAMDLDEDQVHSDASLIIGQGNLFRGQENKEMFFPTTIKFFPTPRDVSVVKEGWTCKGASGVKGGAFKKSQSGQKFLTHQCFRPSLEPPIRGKAKKLAVKFLGRAHRSFPNL